MTLSATHTQFLASVHPYDSLSDAALHRLAARCEVCRFKPADTVFGLGITLEYLYIIVEGEVEITDNTGVQLSILGPRNSFGERAILRADQTTRTATAVAPSTLIALPSRVLLELIAQHASVARFFDRRRPAQPAEQALATMTVGQLMTPDPICCTGDTSIADVAKLMDRHHVYSICVCDARGLHGIVTLHNLNSQVVVGGASPLAPISEIMTRDVLTLAPSALVTDVLHVMVERAIRQVPIMEGPQLVGIVTQTDLTRAQALSSADLVGRVANAEDVSEMALVTRRIPELLVRLVEAGNRHEVVTRLITDIADTATRRLLVLAEDSLGPPPVPYLWLACGSQGRREQTGVTDQDNCMILSDDVTAEQMPYFAKLARFVSDGLHSCGYVYCPGDMMATHPRWCQPLRVWRAYFQGWIAKPDPEAQMLASVMFDLRAIGGEQNLFEHLATDTLKAASENSIFRAHMVANSLKHQPPLGLLRGLATIRSGDHRDLLDLKHRGVVPIVDLARIYTLQGCLHPVNTRARLEAAIGAGILSASGGADLLDAYDLIATMRLEWQVGQIKVGADASNYLDPSSLSDFERSHLRDAFVVVKTMQSAAGSGIGSLR